MKLLDIKKVITEFKTNYTYIDENGVVKKDDYYDEDEEYLNLRGYQPEDSVIYRQLDSIFREAIKVNKLDLEGEVLGVYDIAEEDGNCLLEYVIEDINNKIIVKLLDYELRVKVDSYE